MLFRSSTDALENSVESSREIPDVMEKSMLIRDRVFYGMQTLRNYCDEAERFTARKYWPFPTYGDILFSVR